MDIATIIGLCFNSFQMWLLIIYFHPLSFTNGISDITCAIGCECFRSNNGGIRAICVDYKGTRLPELPPNVTELTIEGGNISKLYRNDSSNYSHLRMLILKNNNLKWIESGSFDNLKKLELLSVFNTYISDLQVNLFLHCENLQRITISKTMAYAVKYGSFSGLETSAYIMNLGDNKIYHIDPNSFAGLLKLEILNLNGNYLTAITTETFGYVPNLSWLLLSNNQIANISPLSFAKLKSVKKLDLHGNKLTKFSLKQELRELDLSDNILNNLTLDSLQGFNSLHELNMDKNIFQNIPNLPITSIRSVKVYSFSYNNKLTSIDKNILARYENLSVLKLKNNPKLTSIEGSSKLTGLTRLEIDWNGLTSINETLLTDSPNLIEAKLEGNPLICGCESRWMRSAMDHPEIYPFVKSWQNMTCRHHIHTWKMIYIPPEEFTCDVPQIIYSHMDLSLAEDSFIEVRMMTPIS